MIGAGMIGETLSAEEGLGTYFAQKFLPRCLVPMSKLECFIKNHNLYT